MPTTHQIGEQVTGTLVGHTIHTYQITASAAGRLSFDFNHTAAGTSAPVHFQLLDSAGRLVANHILVQGGEIETTVSSAGHYFVRLEQNSGFNLPGLYAFTSSFSAEMNVTYDGHLNNSAATALATTLARPVVGALSAGDSDYFSLRANAADKLLINFLHPDGAGREGAAFQVEVIDVATNVSFVRESVVGNTLLTAPIPGGGNFIIKVSDPGNNAGMDSVYSLIASTTNRSGDDLVTGTVGNDFITAKPGNDTIIGRGGFDTVSFAGVRSDFELTFSDAGIIVDHEAGLLGKDTLVNINRLQFADQRIDIGADTNAAQIYRLYDAAFDRVHDAAGMGFWINTLEVGYSLNTVAANFVASAEFKALYGANPGNRELVTQFYQHILERQPEQAGIDYWAGVLDSGASDVAGVLAAISESSEHQVLLIGEISHGISYTPC